MKAIFNLTTKQTLVHIGLLISAILWFGLNFTPKKNKVYQNLLGINQNALLELDLDNNPQNGIVPLSEKKNKTRFFIPGDNDNDGILDENDLDDDNDGILDTDESSCSSAGSQGNVSIESQSGVFGSGDISDGNTTTLARSFFSAGSYIVVDLGSVVSTGQEINLYFAKTQNPNFTAEISEVPSGNYIPGGGSNQLTIDQSDIESTANGGSQIDYTLAQATRYIQIEVINRSGSGNLVIREVEFIITTCTEFDTDSDGIINRFDIDSDNDGIPDNVEAQSTSGYIAPSGFQNGITDANGNGLDDNYESAQGGTDLNAFVNTDGIDNPDYLDDDSDNDGIPDIQENGDSDNTLSGADSDGDGLDDNFDTVTDFDVNDNINNPSSDLPDSDGDLSLGGDVDYRDGSDDDNDNDGVPDEVDLDDDNDGILDVDEGCDISILSFPKADKAYLFQSSLVYTIDVVSGASNLETSLPESYNNITINELDLQFWGIPQDSDNITTIDPNSFAITTTSTVISHEVNSSVYDPVRRVIVFGGEGNYTVVGADPNAANYLTITKTFVSGPNTVDFTYNATNGFYYGIQEFSNNLIELDIDNDTATNLGAVTGLPSGLYGAAYSLFNGRIFVGNNGTGGIYELDVQNLTATLFSNGPSSSLNDGAKVLGVDFNGNPICLDSDNDGVPDAMDIDSDNDGIPDNVEAQPTNGYISPSGIETGITDTNNNGLDDNYESSQGGIDLNPEDTDNDGTPDYLDDDSDNDGVPDIQENGRPDAITSPFTDSDGDGMDDAFDTVNGFDVNDDVNTPSVDLPDVDNDVNTGGNVDYRDVASGVLTITQLYKKDGTYVFELSNIGAETVISGQFYLNSFLGSSGNNSGVAPSESVLITATVPVNQSVIIHPIGFNGATLINSPPVINNNNITSYPVSGSPSQNFIIISSSNDTSAWDNRVDVVYDITGTGFNTDLSLVRTDEVTSPNTTYTASEWVAFVDDDIATYAGGTSITTRHPHDPLFSEATAGTPNSNVSFGYHRTGPTNYSSGAWDNGLPDRSRIVFVQDDLVHSGSTFSARQLSVFNAKLSIIDNLLAVTNELFLLLATDEIRLIDTGGTNPIGRSQLVSTHTGSSLVVGNGKLIVDQNSEVNSLYRYNYISSPVNTVGTNTYTFDSVIKDGTTPTSESSTLLDINFVNGNNYDGAPTNPITLADYWMYTYGASGAWTQIRSTGTIPQTDGVIFKGPNRPQNYTFTGTPKDGNLTTTIGSNSSYLLGNPYPSAIDARKFIEDNSSSTTGTLYFWEHQESINGDVDIKSHYFAGYIGGYAIRNIAMGLAANNPSNSSNNDNGIAGLGEGTYREPATYIPIGQGFFVSGSTSGGTITFKNSQREYITEGANAVFYKSSASHKNNTVNSLPVLKLGMNYKDENNQELHRQIGVSFLATNSFEYDNGYDSMAFDLGPTDIYFDFGNDNPYFIAGVQEITDDLKVPLTIAMRTEGEISIQIDEWQNIDRDVYLLEKKENGPSDNPIYYIPYLLNNGAVNLNLSEGIHKDRFFLGFKNTTLGITNPILETSISIWVDQQEKLLKLENRNNIDIKSVQLFDLLGKELKNWDDRAIKDTKLGLKGLSNAVYVVVVKTSQGTMNKKIIIQN